MSSSATDDDDGFADYLRRRMDGVDPSADDIFQAREDYDELVADGYDPREDQ